MILSKPVSLLVAEALLFWQVTNYLLTPDTTRHSLSSATAKPFVWLLVRALSAAIVTFVVAAGWPGLLLAAVMFAGCLLLPLARSLWVPSRYIAELEVLANLGFAALTQYLSIQLAIHARWIPVRTPAAENRLAAYIVSLAILIFVVRGGTFIVRGVLDRAGTMPPQELPDSAGLAAPGAVNLRRALPVDTVELNHGRLIGNVERIILVLFVAKGQYTALAFFFAAKGLIRSKDVERRAWADYLILGSLTSFLVAVVAGMLIQAVFQAARLGYGH